MEVELAKEKRNSDSRGRSPKEKRSIEEVVNRVTEKPTWMYFLMLLGLMSFNLTCPLVAYFPNFGGYVPYSDWRCMFGSKDCLNRTSKFLDQGWQSQSVGVNKELVYIESRCSMKLRQFNTSLDVQILELYREDIEYDQNFNIGSIIFDSNAQQISVRSYIQCKNSKKSCTKDFPFTFEVDSKTFECNLIFAGSTLEQEESTISCGAAKLTLTDDEGILTVVELIKNIDLKGIGTYDLHCPDKDQYNRDNLCGTGDSNMYDGQMNVGKDFYWYTQGRTSFSIDWNLYCDREYLRSMISSVYFGGAWLGLIVGGTLYDLIGRKRGALVGYGVVIAACFASAASTSIEFLFVCRFFQGSGVFLGYTGMYVLLLEYAATKYRALVNTAILMMWAVGYLLVTFTGYMIHDWHWLAATSGFLFLTLHLIPLILTPQSPSFLLVTKRDVEGAKASLRWLMMLNRSSFDLEGVVLEDTVEETEEPSFADTMKDFWKYKEMLVQMLIQMWLWIVAAFIYYGFSFSWSSLGKDIYMSYLYAAIGEIVAYTVLTLPLEYWGRKNSHIMMFLVGSASFLLAMIPYKISGSFTVEQLSCLIGSMFVSAVFGFIYLYTIELSPTSHRGRICSYCSITARLGAFSGTYASLMFGWSKKGTLIIFAVLSGLAGLATFRLPDTKGVLTPASAEEVQSRRKRYL